MYSVNTLGMILSVVLGAITGTALDLDGKMLRLGNYVEKKVNQKQEKTVSIAQGFVNATLLFCVGAMAITGPIESALTVTTAPYLPKPSSTALLRSFLPPVWESGYSSAPRQFFFTKEELPFLPILRVLPF